MSSAQIAHLIQRRRVVVAPGPGWQRTGKERPVEALGAERVLQRRADAAVDAGHRRCQLSVGEALAEVDDLGIRPRVVAKDLEQRLIAHGLILACGAPYGQAMPATVCEELPKPFLSLGQVENKFKRCAWCVGISR